MEAFNAVVYYSNPGMQPIDVMKRVGRLMELHTIIE
uniref:Uncharacterized protein n=1 Tax=Acrobeloides nanus TaxID=290746 RepID=A0A914CLZ6_9BILA